MKDINKLFKRLIIGTAAAITLGSCDDYLTIEPMGEVVDTKFWTEEADVTTSVTGCYALLQSQDCIRRMMVWGELRSDNITFGNNPPNEIRQILNENILETNKLTQWDAIYKVINQCNTVIHYTLQVTDPNLTPSEMILAISEAVTLRSLCYFYLLRTFRDVPYITEPSLEDSQNYVVAATPMANLLDQLISDVESVVYGAVISYGDNSIENTSRITRWACYALLADMCLWKGDYEKCIYYCQQVINHKIDEYKRELAENPSQIEMELYGDYPLIADTKTGSTDGGLSYNAIFAKGNSFESIFELNFSSARSTNTKNNAVDNYYGISASLGQWAVPADICKRDGGGQPLFQKSDCRFVENINSTPNQNSISKYVYSEVNLRIQKTSETVTTTKSPPKRTDQFANWIIYRLTDVMLMMAEAEVELAGDVDADAGVTAEQTAHYKRAWDCVMAVWNRANAAAKPTSAPKFTDYAVSRRSMEDLVLKERQRELMFEGKRWFDLVRMSLRDGNNIRMIDLVLPKFNTDQTAVRNRLTPTDALFFPYYRDELIVNPLLKQNPAYKTNDNYELY